MQRKNGFSILIVIFLLVVLIAGVLLLAFVVKKDKVTQLVNPSGTPRVVDSEEAGSFESPAPVSDSTDLDTIKAEFNATVVGSPEDDFTSLDSSASSL